MDPRTLIGAVHLTVADRALLETFYTRHLGMRVRRREDARVWLGTRDRDLLVLTERAGATRPERATGLYHFAVLTPSRAELARSLRRLGETKTPLQGASDHGVSEAIYLADPEGNGIEIYRDRARDEWPRVNGSINMTVDPLDLQSVLDELEPDAQTLPYLHDDTVMGHVHLHVSRLPETEAFYSDVLGFDVMQRYGHGALFVSAGGYHHHLGVNTWAGVGLPPAPEGSLGLDHFVVSIPHGDGRDAVLERLAEAGVATSTTGEGVLVRDPSGNAMLLS